VGGVGREVWTRFCRFSTRGAFSTDFQEALAALVGTDAPNLSPAALCRLTAERQGEYERWQKRDLSAHRYVYAWADGVFLLARMEAHGECMLVLIGATPEGKKETHRLPGWHAREHAELARTARRGEKPGTEDRSGNRRR
jgi:hypothetical protein